MEDIDPYDILGVDRSCSDDDVKNAYRRLARKHHPDKGGSDVMFRRIQAAFESIKDEESRARHAGGGGFNPFDIFMGGGAAVDRRRIPDIEKVVEVSCRDAYSGATIRYTHKRKRVRPGVNMSSPCAMCRGRGRMVRRQPMFVMGGVLVVCPECAGLGVRVSAQDMEIMTEAIGIDLPAFCPDGYRVVVKSRTDEMPGMQTGDLILVIRHKAEGLPLGTEVNGGHIITSVPITLADALFGFVREVEFIDGSKKTIVLPSGTSLFVSSEPRIILRDLIRRVPGMGFYHGTDLRDRGDWLIRFDISFPVGSTMGMTLTHDGRVCTHEPGCIDVSALEPHSPPQRQQNDHHNVECRQS